MEMNKYQRNKVKAEAACEIAETILYHIQDNEDTIGNYKMDIDNEMEKPEEERSNWRIDCSKKSAYSAQLRVDLWKELLKYIDGKWMIF